MENSSLEIVTSDAVQIQSFSPLFAAIYGAQSLTGFFGEYLKFLSFYENNQWGF